MRRFALAVIFTLAAASAEARPLYLRVYQETFRENQKLKCSLCHMGDSKKYQNDYGKLFESKLPGRNIQDVEVIHRVLLEIGPAPIRRPE
jgi:hypothetical protein